MVCVEMTKWCCRKRHTSINVNGDSEITSLCRIAFRRRIGWGVNKSVPVRWQAATYGGQVLTAGEDDDFQVVELWEYVTEASVQTPRDVYSALEGTWPSGPRPAALFVPRRVDERNTRGDDKPVRCMGSMAWSLRVFMNGSEQHLGVELDVDVVVSHAV